MLENLTAYAIAKLYVTKNLDHFAPFDYTLRHIVLNNSVGRHIRRNPPKLS